jgi:hypothetical protein
MVYGSGSEEEELREICEAQDRLIRVEVAIDRESQKRKKQVDTY